VTQCAAARGVDKKTKNSLSFFPLLSCPFHLDHHSPLSSPFDLLRETPNSDTIFQRTREKFVTIKEREQKKDHPYLSLPRGFGLLLGCCS